MTWPEQKKQIQTNKGLEKKSPRHYEVSTKKSYQTTLRQPILSSEEADFMQNTAKYIDEFSPLYNKALQSSTRDKWTARADYIKLLIKKALEHSIKDKEAQHFIMYLHEIKEDLKTQEPLKESTINIEIYKVQRIIDNFKTIDDYNNAMHILGQITIDHHPSISQQEKMREMSQVLNKKANELDRKNGKELVDEFTAKIEKATTIDQLNHIKKEYEEAVGNYRFITVSRDDNIKLRDLLDNKIKSLKIDNSVYKTLIEYINAAETTQKLDDLHQDANRAEVKGQITFEQLQEIYMLINDRDEKIRVAQKEKLKNLQSQYQVGDFLERLPDIESVIKPGIYTITQIVPHKEMTFGNTSPTDVRVVNEYRVAKVQPDGTLNQVGGMVLTATMLSNTFKKTTPANQSELNKATIEQTKKILIEDINSITTLKGLDEFDVRLKEHLIANGITSVEDPRIIDVIVALNKRRRDLTGSMAKIDLSSKKIEYETKNMEYEASHLPKEFKNKDYTEEDIKSHVWGMLEKDAIQKYADKELAKYQSNLNYVQKEKEKLDQLVAEKPHVLLTKAEIQKQFPKDTDRMISDLWNYKSLKSTYDKNLNGTKYWSDKAEKIKSGEWAEKNKNSLKEQYAKEVKKAISSGAPVPASVVAQYSEFTKSKSNRERYQRGYDTSFANKSIAVDDSFKSVHGIKIKRQDGRAITKEQADEIVSDIKVINSVLGDITPILRKEDITIAHTSGKNPFLSQAGGLYHPSEKSITIGTGTKASVHEVTHALDWASRTADEPLYDYKLLGIAKATMNTGAERLLSLSRKEGDALKEARAFRMRLGKYWTRPEEIFARLIEQYVSYKHREPTTAHDSYENYTQTPAWWSNEAFTNILPLIEAEIQRKVNLASK